METEEKSPRRIFIQKSPTDHLVKGSAPSSPLMKTLHH